MFYVFFGICFSSFLMSLVLNRRQQPGLSNPLCDLILWWSCHNLYFLLLFIFLCLLLPPLVSIFPHRAHSLILALILIYPIILMWLPSGFDEWSCFTISFMHFLLSAVITLSNHVLLLPVMTGHYQILICSYQLWQLAVKSKFILITSMMKYSWGKCIPSKLSVCVCVCVHVYTCLSVFRWVEKQRES